MSIIFEGYLRGLSHEVKQPIEYSISNGSTATGINTFLGNTVQIAFAGNRACNSCGRKVKKLYQSGYCFPCATSLAECDLCIVKPHECHFHLGTCRDEDFGRSHCMIPHVVYLAYSSGVKVGLTRKGRQWTRWVDQGATSAILLAEVQTRKAAGELEMAVAEHLPDKTDWRKMIKQTMTDPSVDLIKLKAEVVERLAPEYHACVHEDDTVHDFCYPRLPDYEAKLTSVSLDKQSVFTSRLKGVKGQYLLFEDGVFNVKKHAGYHVQISV